MTTFDLGKSINFLLENAGPVIKYRLRKEILRDIAADEAESLLEQIYNTPHFKLTQSYVKPNGYIGSGMHSWDNWRGVKLHETPLQDGEAAARLLSYYAIPKDHPIIVNFIAAMRDDAVLREEFSYIPPEIARYESRFLGLRNGGNSLMALMYAMQAMLGYGDDEYVLPFQKISLDAFASIARLHSIHEIAKTKLRAEKKYGYPYIEEDVYFPCAYHLSALAYTRVWRSPENIRILANAIDRLSRAANGDAINNITGNIDAADCFKCGVGLHVKIKSSYYVPLWAFIRKLEPFRADTFRCDMYRRPLTEIAMLGVGDSVGVIRESAINITEALDTDGILRLSPSLPKKMRIKHKFMEYPTAYSDVRLEPDYKSEIAILCDLTFWAVQFLTLAKNGCANKLTMPS